jgi:hypothetical protein
MGCTSLDALCFSRGKPGSSCIIDGFVNLRTSVPVDFDCRITVSILGLQGQLSDIPRLMKVEDWMTCA